MEFFRNTHFDFVKFRYIAITCSLILICSGLISMAIKGGLRMGVDFKGGILMQVSFNKAPSIEEVRSALKTINLQESIIQEVSGRNDLIIRVEKDKTAGESGYEGIKQQVTKALEDKYGKDSFRFERLEYVGPVVGKDMVEKSVLATIFSFLGIIIYLSFRFEFKYGVAAIIALVHDVLTTLALFSFLNKEFTPTILAAILTLVGYSVNDTIVVYDRIRENVHLHSKEGLPDLVNNSVNETLSRTVITSLTTFFSVTVLFFFGGPVIHDFAFAMMFGIVTGTYSSIYIAAPILIDWDRFLLKKKVS
ncbi:MAG: protein translocase subunit SecF [bacterium]|nr:protein translocase subunit SecF [bacterium]